jgi:mannose-6-phosphate isomerase-like protein (cupin superfamily)
VKAQGQIVAGTCRGPGERCAGRAADTGKRSEIGSGIGGLLTSTETAGPVYSAIMAHVIERDGWAEAPDRWQGELQCGAFGSKSCLIFNHLPGIGGGPRLHKHPYAEIFIIRSGTGLFTVGEREIEACAGQILIVRHAAQIHQSRPGSAGNH